MIRKLLLDQSKLEKALSKSVGIEGELKLTKCTMIQELVRN